jgi:hypothetical protein
LITRNDPDIVGLVVFLRLFLERRMRMNIQVGAARAMFIGFCICIGVLVSPAAHAQYFTGDGWVRSDVIEIIGGVGGASCDTGGPYVSAYEGQTSATTVAQAHYSQYFHTNYPGVHNGTVYWSANIVGTLGFYSNPTNYSYHSDVYGVSQTKTDNSGYNISTGNSFNITGTTYTFEATPNATIHDYGHASAEIGAYVQGRP